MNNSPPSQGELRQAMKALGINWDEDVTLDLIRKKYFKLVRVVHPDSTDKDQVDEEKTKALTGAYKLLVKNFDRLSYVHQNEPQPSHTSESSSRASRWDTVPPEQSRERSTAPPSPPSPVRDEKPPAADPAPILSTSHRFGPMAVLHGIWVVLKQFPFFVGVWFVGCCVIAAILAIGELIFGGYPIKVTTGTEVLYITCYGLWTIGLFVGMAMNGD